MARKLTRHQTTIVKCILKELSNRTDLVINITDFLDSCMEKHAFEVLTKNIVFARKQKENIKEASK